MFENHVIDGVWDVCSGAWPGLSSVGNGWRRPAWERSSRFDLRCSGEQSWFVIVSAGEVDRGWHVVVEAHRDGECGLSGHVPGYEPG